MKILPVIFSVLVCNPFVCHPDLFRTRELEPGKENKKYTEHGPQNTYVSLFPLDRENFSALLVTLKLSFPYPEYSLGS